MKQLLAAFAIVAVAAGVAGYSGTGFLAVVAAVAPVDGVIPAPMLLLLALYTPVRLGLPYQKFAWPKVLYTHLFYNIRCVIFESRFEAFVPCFALAK
ncbi:hypothetical protein EBR96_04475, partial [bacterium]|nr:hypothetical protein [bacterium]